MRMATVPMTLTFLGTGTSCGVPTLGCTCEVCRSTDARDKRLRTAALLECGDTRILIDCGPDIRQQFMPLPFGPLTGVLLTHIHYDHVGGLDDLRPFSAFGDTDIYADAATVAGVRRAMPYCFTDKLYPGVPKINLHTLVARQAFRLGEVEVLPVQVMHGKLPILAYRFGPLAYVTDMKSISDADATLLEGVDTLVVNALRWEKPHHSHMLVGDAIRFSRRLGARSTYFIHMNHDIGLHADVCRRLPQGFTLAYDGLRIKINR